MVGLEASNFNGHSSSRYGGQPHKEKTLGRWESDAYQRYIKIPERNWKTIVICLHLNFYNENNDFNITV